MANISLASCVGSAIGVATFFNISSERLFGGAATTSSATGISLAAAQPPRAGPAHHLACVITSELFCDPVIAQDGHSYERAAISRWLENHDTSPKTGERLTSKSLIPNHTLRAQVQDHREESGLSPLPPWQPPPPPPTAAPLPTQAPAFNAAPAAGPTALPQPGAVRIDIPGAEAQVLLARIREVLAHPLSAELVQRLGLQGAGAHVAAHSVLRHPGRVLEVAAVAATIAGLEPHAQVLRSTGERLQALISRANSMRVQNGAVFQPQPGQQWSLSPGDGSGGLGAGTTVGESAPAPLGSGGPFAAETTDTATVGPPLQTSGLAAPASGEVGGDRVAEPAAATQGQATHPVAPPPEQQRQQQQQQQQQVTARLELPNAPVIYPNPAPAPGAAPDLLVFRLARGGDVSGLQRELVSLQRQQPNLFATAATRIANNSAATAAGAGGGAAASSSGDGRNAAAPPGSTSPLTVSPLDKLRNGSAQHSLLHVAVMSGQVDVVRMLLSPAFSNHPDFSFRGSPADPLLPAARSGGGGLATPLHLSCARPGSTEVVKLLLSAIRNVDATSAGGAPAARGGSDGKGVDKADIHGNTSLHVAASLGNIDAIELLLPSGNNSNHSPPASFSSSSSSSSALTTAASEDVDPPPAPRLFASVHALSLNGGTPLHGACGHGRAGAVKLLLERGADPLAVEHVRHFNPLHFAAQAGAELCIEAILEHATAVEETLASDGQEAGAPTTDRAKSSAKKAATAAAAEETGNKGGSEAKAAGAVGKGVSSILRAAGKQGVQPLHVAAAGGHAGAVRLLGEWILRLSTALSQDGGNADEETAEKVEKVDNAAAVPATDRGNSAAASAEEEADDGDTANGSPAAPSGLGGAPSPGGGSPGMQPKHHQALSARTDEGHTALSLACVHALRVRTGGASGEEEEEEPSALKALLELGVDPAHDALANCTRDVDGFPMDGGRFPLHGALASKRSSVALLLVRSGAPLSFRTKNKSTPLHLASWYGLSDVVTAVLAKAPDLMHAVNEDGDTAVHQASFNGHADVVKLLLDHKPASVHARKVNGATALHLAAARGFVGVCRLLLERGASARAVDAHGQTPRALALTHPNVLAALDEHEAAVVADRN